MQGTIDLANLGPGDHLVEVAVTADEKFQVSGTVTLQVHIIEKEEVIGPDVLGPGNGVNGPNGDNDGGGSAPGEDNTGGGNRPDDGNGGGESAPDGGNTGDGGVSDDSEGDRSQDGDGDRSNRPSDD